MTRYTPALWSLFVLIPMINFLSFLRVVDPAIWFAATGFWLAGAVFIYDGLTIWPDKGKIVGLSAAIIFMVIGVINIGFGAAVFMGVFNPFVGSSEWIPYAVVTLGLGTAALFIAGTVEVILARHYGKELKQKLMGR